MKKVLLVLGVLLVMALTKSRAENLISNGSFEVMFYNPNAIVSCPVGSTNLPGWTISGTGGFYLLTAPVSGSSFLALDGQQFVDFNYTGTRLSQPFQTKPGEAYEVSFSVGKYQGPGNMQAVAEVLSPDGTVLGSLAVDAPVNPGWRSPSRFRFTAASDASTLRFWGRNMTVNVDLLLDAVSVEPVTQTLTGEISHIRLCWPSKTNRFYQLQYRSVLTTNLWTDVDAPIPGTGDPVCNIQAITTPQRYFRTILLP